MRRLVIEKDGKTRCPFCKVRFYATERNVVIHMYRFHCPEGYSFSCEKIESNNKNRYPGLLRLKIVGPCACGCEEMLHYPNEKGWTNPKEPPYYIANHYQSVAPRNSGMFVKGQEPANKGKKFPGTANSGSFKKGQIPKTYKGGVAIIEGYAYILDPSGEKYPCGARKRIGRARMVMEKVLGRKLTKGEVVVHKDRDKLNDIPENLEVISKKESFRRHKKGEYNKYTQELMGSSLVVRTRIQRDKEKFSRKTERSKERRILRTRSYWSVHGAEKELERILKDQEKLWMKEFHEPKKKVIRTPRVPKHTVKEVSKIETSDDTAIKEPIKLIRPGDRVPGICPICRTLRNPIKGCRCD